MHARSILLVGVLIPSLFAGCTSDPGSASIEVSVVPQNHSGKPYTFHVQIFDAQDAKKFDKTYTLSETAHMGPTTKVMLAAGTYRAQLDAERDDAGSPKTTSTSANFAIAASSTQVAVMIDTDESLKVRVS